MTASECVAIAGLYADDRHVRSHIVMARYGFGRGEYKYFTYPLPDDQYRLTFRWENGNAYEVRVEDDP